MKGSATATDSLAGTGSAMTAGVDDSCYQRLDQGLILPMLYEQLLCSQIPKGQKRQSSCHSFLHFWDFLCAKAAHKMFMKLTPEFDFNNILLAAFKSTDYKSKKDTDDLTVFLHFWDLGSWASKSYD